MIVLLLAAVFWALAVMLGMTSVGKPVPHAAVAALLVPVGAWRVARAWRCVDPVALRAAKTLGIGRRRRWMRLILPVVARALVVDLLVTGIVAMASILILAFSLGRVGAYTASP